MIDFTSWSEEGQLIDALVFAALATVHARSDAERAWSEFDEDIRNRNRFNPNVDRIKIAMGKFREQCTYHLPRSSVCYRARLIGEGKLKDIIADKPFYATLEEKIPKDRVGIYQMFAEILTPWLPSVFQHAVESGLPDTLTEDDRLSLQKLLDGNLEGFCNGLGEGMEKEITATAKRHNISTLSNKDLLNKIESILVSDDEILSKLKDIAFWGYDAEKSDAPPNQFTDNMRVSPKGISYLYIAEDIPTVIAEVRPIIGQPVSVAEVQILRDLKLFDFTLGVPSFGLEESGMPIMEAALLRFISEQFSSPNYSGDDEYFATQYISEMLKVEGFDGIRFQSSLNKTGTNIVLFDVSKQDDLGLSRNYEITSSKIYTMEDISISIRQRLPSMN